MNRAGEAIVRAHRDPTVTHVHAEDLTAPFGGHARGDEGAALVLVDVNRGRCPREDLNSGKKVPAIARLLPTTTSKAHDVTERLRESRDRRNQIWRGQRNGRQSLLRKSGWHIVLIASTRRTDALRNITLPSPRGATYAKVSIQCPIFAYLPRPLTVRSMIKIATTASDARRHSHAPPTGDFVVRVAASQFTQPEAGNDLRESWQTETRAATEATFGTLANQRGVEFKKVAIHLPKDRGPPPNFCDAPAKHWHCLCPDWQTGQVCVRLHLPCSHTQQVKDVARNA